MKVVFRRSGGFAPMPIGCDLDTQTMPPDECQRLQLLIEDSGVMDMHDAEVKGARDVHYYHIEIEGNGKSKKLKLDQLSVPPQAKPLIDFLIKHSKQLLPDD